MHLFVAQYLYPLLIDKRPLDLPVLGGSVGIAVFHKR